MDSSVVTLLRGWVPSLALALLSACSPRSVAEAERRGDVAWLDAEGSGEAVAALGRLADVDPRAAQVIDARAGTDVNAYIAAWTATRRGAGWGAATLRTGLGNPTRAEATASVMTRKDPHLIPFVPDLEGALVRLAASKHNTAISAVLASVGPAADAAITRRLADSSTRGALCRGIGSPDANASARLVLMHAPVSSRDDESCVEAVLIAALHDDAALDWLASSAEPGLLSAAGSREAFPCARLAAAWSKAFVARAQQPLGGLTVPLHSSVARCARALDPVLAPALTAGAVHLRAGPRRDRPLWDRDARPAVDLRGAQADLSRKGERLYPRASARGRDPWVRVREVDEARGACRATRGRGCLLHDAKVRRDLSLRLAPARLARRPRRVGGGSVRLPSSAWWRLRGQGRSGSVWMRAPPRAAQVSRQAPGRGRALRRGLPGPSEPGRSPGGALSAACGFLARGFFAFAGFGPLAAHGARSRGRLARRFGRRLDHRKGARSSRLSGGGLGLVRPRLRGNLGRHVVGPHHPSPVLTDHRIGR